MGIKDTILAYVSKSKEKFYPIDTLKELGYHKKICKICGRTFWTKDINRTICADHDKYYFINNPISKKKLSYGEVWSNFEEYFTKKNYFKLNRYPVVARWRDDLDFVIASITCFQPWVTEGIVEPPSKKLVIPQFCLRFNDIGNIGYTGRHYSGFVMIGQHAFVPPEEYDINSYFLDLYNWFVDNLRIPSEEIIFHEDVWEGGGNAGTSIEFFIGGLEVANQVYMKFKVVDNNIKLLDNLHILDMGMGHERVAWLLVGDPVSYKIVFPNTIGYLLNHLKEDINLEDLKTIAPELASFDFEEYNTTQFLNYISKKYGDYYKELLEKSAAIFSIADHIRTLMIAISDGILPSNIGGGYNLRLIARRMFLFLDKYFDSIDFTNLIKKSYEDWIFKDIDIKILDSISEILEYEYKKYLELKKHAKKILLRYSLKDLDSEKVFQLYTSHGISPEMIKEILPSFEIPQEFYQKLKEFRKISKSKKEIQKNKFNLKNIPKTNIKYYEEIYELETEVIKILEDNYVVFKDTIFYPTKGGQLHDTGKIFIPKLKEEYEIKNVIEYKGIIIHKLDKEPNFQEGEKVILKLDKDRREILSKHHTATHLLTGYLRKRYGNFIWQAGAEKSPEKARLDITYYRNFSKEELQNIERDINSLIWKGAKVTTEILPRNIAEQRYGFSIYQGGYIPEINLRIVKIENIDVEACSGTHLKNIKDIGIFKIINSSKIADGIIRIEFAVERAALKYIQELDTKIKNIQEDLKISLDNVISYVKKIDKERSEYKSKYIHILEQFIDNLLEKNGGNIKLDLSDIDPKDIIPIIVRRQDKIKSIDITLKNARLLSSIEELPIVNKEKIKKIGKFYLIVY